MMVKKAKSPVAPVIADDEYLEEEEGQQEAAPVLQEAAPPPVKAGVSKPKATTPRVTMPGYKGVMMMKILLEDNADIPPSGQFIGHNGTSYMLKPGIWVEVPMPIIEILNNAVQKVPDRDPVTNQIIGWREKMRYPYRVPPGSMPHAA